MSEKPSLSDIYNRDIEEYARLSSMLSKSIHDINNPLAVFIGQISIIELLQKRGELNSDKMEKIVEKFKTSSETLKDRIGYLRNFYKVLINDSQFPNLDNAVASACYVFENEAYLAGVDYRVEHIENTRVTMPSNQVYLVVKHLVQNALDSILRNNIEGGEIHVICSQNGDKVKVSVSDNGPGLLCDINTAQELGYTTKANKTGGTGLAIIKKVLKDNGSNLSYEKDGKCIFTFELDIEHSSIIDN